MIIGFTGHRDKEAYTSELQYIEDQNPGATWVHGGAEGFDEQVHEFALELGKVEGKDLFVIRPDYKLYHPKVAPLKRNELIVQQANEIYALYDGRARGGTLYTINYARSLGKPVTILTPFCY